MRAGPRTLPSWQAATLPDHADRRTLRMSRRTAKVAGKKERQRKLARDAHQRRMQRQAERARRAKQLSVMAIVFVLVAGGGVLSAYIAGAFTTRPAAAAANSSASPSVAASACAPTLPTAPAAPEYTAALVHGKGVDGHSGATGPKEDTPAA